jgi:hypothetical protein
MCAISFLTSTAIKLFLPFVARFLFAFFVFVFVLLILTFAFSASLRVPGFLELSELHPKKEEGASSGRTLWTTKSVLQLLRPLIVSALTVPRMEWN